MTPRFTSSSPGSAGILDRLARRLGFRAALQLGLFLTPLLAFASGWTPGHYLYYQTLNGPVNGASVGAEFRGAVVSYAWNLLESGTPGNFANGYAAIDRDIAALAPLGKKMIIFIKYKTFTSGLNLTPAYITQNNQSYGGGVYQNKNGGYDPVMWDSRVRARMDALLAALGARYNSNPTVEAILLPESAANRPIGEIGGPNETSFNTALALQGTYTHYSKTALVTEVKAYVQAMGTAFPNTATALYATGNDMLDLLVTPTLSEQMSASDVGLGNPDILPTYTNNEYNGTGSAYDHYPAKSNLEPLIPQLQNPDWARTYLDGTPVSIADFYNHAKNNLKVTHMVWDLTGRTGVDAQVRSFLTPLIASDPAGGLNAQVPSSMAGQPAPLPAPTNLAATVNGAQVVLNWTDVATTNTGYKIERRAAQGANGLIGVYSQIGTAGANATSYTDNTAAPGTEYDYLVRANNGTINSAYAGPVTVTTGAATLQAESATLAGGVVAVAGNGAHGTGYADYPTTGGSVTFTVNAATAGSYQLSFRHANGGTAARTLTRLVNGGGSTVMSFPVTGAWTTWGTVTATVTLNAGSNTISLTGGASPSGPNLDEMVVTKL